MGSRPIAAIWCRVSTQDQRELSLDSQEAAVRKVVESQNYTVPNEYILKVDWTSMDLLACPEFQRLREWVHRGAVRAVGVLDRDRLQAQGLQRLIFLSDCKEHDVQIITAQGVPMLEGPEGQLIELALALGKERSVLRAQQGAKDGLRDRAVLRGLPAAPRNPYGYVWDDARTRLISTRDWDTARFICRSSLEGWPIRRIRQELHRRAILAPSGNEWWNPQGIYRILTNPLYGGRYYALRKEHYEPRNRRVPGYGKTSGRYKPIEEAVFLPNVVVENPPLAWEEWGQVQERMKANKLRAQRNGRRDYLLRSLVICDTHNRRYHGQPHNYMTWRYTCPAHRQPGLGRCVRPYLHGPQLEESLTQLCRRILTTPELIDREIRTRLEMVEATTESLRTQLKALDRKEARNLNTETNLLLEKARGNASDEAFERTISMVKAERSWIAEEQERLRGQLEATQRVEALTLNLEKIRERVGDRLETASNEDWRLVFEAPELEVHLAHDGSLEAHIALPTQEASQEGAIVSPSTGPG